MNKRLRLPLALSLALGSSSVAALGLGRIEVTSALNQPLAAEIPVLSTQPGETDNLVVRLAPPEALARVGMQAPTGVAANLEFVVDTNVRGEKIIRVTTPDKVADPFVTFLLEVDWGGGKMLREYTILLDPPTMAPVRHTAAATPVSEPTAPSDAETLPLAEVPPPPETTEMPAPEPPAEAPPPLLEAVAEAESQPEPVAESTATEPAPQAEPEPEPEPSRTDTYGPVVEGETLWQIAQFARPDDSVTMNQMMLALLYANPDAFIGQNINRLKRGAILRIPSKEESLGIAAADAAAQVQAQSQAWRDTQKPVMQPAEPLIDVVADTALTATAPTPTDSRLELLPPRSDMPAARGAQSGATLAGEGSELRAELARSRESLSTLTQENVDLKTRVGELEQIQSDSQRLLELKDSELAAATQRLRELEAQAAAAAAVAADPAPVAQTPAVDAAVEVPATPDTGIDPSVPPPVEPTTEVASLPSDETTPPETGAITPPDADVTAPVDPAPAETAPATSPTAVAPMPERPPQAPIWTNPWVIGGIALVVVGLLALLLGRRRAAATATAPARFESRTVASSVAAVQANAVARDTAEDDGRLDDLVAAISRDPANLGRHLELVRHYYDANDADGFENAAEAMYSRVYDPDDLAWKQVLAMGQEIAPEHPLFVMTDESESTHAPEPAPIPRPATAVPAVPKPTPPPVREIDWGSPPPTSPAPVDNASTQKMRIEDVRPSLSQTVQNVEPDLPEAYSYDPATADSSEAGGAFLDADAASTKLELARAYLDMGDIEGARGMLEEVVGEGNPGQRAEAKRLLDEIR